MKEKCEHENTAIIADGWSKACLDCGCYSYDFGGNWQNEEDSLEHFSIWKVWINSQSKKEIVDQCIRILKERTSK